MHRDRIVQMISLIKTGGMLGTAANEIVIESHSSLAKFFQIDDAKATEFVRSCVTPEEAVQCLETLLTAETSEPNNSCV
jgi:hypothetical protein